ncbi:hypothetical protein FIV42_12735 [Persicimonas caeni]|uniref:Uncharacterized protein n=1 Tax=Persicimonas caeni TaxID=2292766 RepID=A0A4Y6PTK4_PERCE|nr:hypothetical protein [Persicimonas caeni]QDG51580.1 hypothetical protein FIV42_12735 [Persicimonas caeni]QED32801.1 hypothetical protein FRD00_12730 [Persicimonas caeni]
MTVLMSGSGCTTLLPAPVKVDETEISRTPLDSPRLMTEEISSYEISASTEANEETPNERELSGQGEGVRRVYQRCVQRVELEVDETWRQEYSSFGYVLDGTGAVTFGFVGAFGVARGITESERRTSDLVTGGVFLAAAAAFGYSIYAGLQDSGTLETKRKTRSTWVDASGCDNPSPSASAAE